MGKLVMHYLNGQYAQETLNIYKNMGYEPCRLDISTERDWYLVRASIDDYEQIREESMHQNWFSRLLEYALDTYEARCEQRIQKTLNSNNTKDRI